MIKMITPLFANYLALYLIVTIVLFISAVCYIYFVYMPFAKFRSCRLEPRILRWVLKRVPINYAVFHTFIDLSKRHVSEGVFAVWIGIPILVVYGDDMLKKIVSEHAASVKPKSYELLEWVCDKCLLTSNGELWKKQNKMAAPAFHVTSIKSYTCIMNKHSEEVVDRLSKLDGQPIDYIGHIMGVFALSTISESNLGEDTVNNEEFIYVMESINKAASAMTKRQFSPWLYLDISLRLFPSTREILRIRTKVLEESLKPRLQKIKESLISRQASADASDSDCELNQGRRFKPFGEMFVEQHLQDPTITMDEVTRQMAFLLVAAFDTVAHTLEFALYLLGLHKDVQERAFQEVMSETGEHVTYDDQQRLTFLECVIKETLRMYPVVPIGGRTLTKDLQVGKYQLPRNSTILMFTFMLHRNAEIYPDPEKFHPERFMDENSRIKPWNFVPFAEGFRPCLGKNYAMTEMKILLAHVLRNFKIVSLDRMEEADLTWSIMLSCRKKIRMQFLPRA